ncbi:MAG TPA: hypothetical protein VIF43_02255 [Patescibacteria group bacterium]
MPGYVPEELLHPLLVELAAAEFEPQERDYGRSIQNIESYELHPPFPRHPIVRAIAESLQWFEDYDPEHVSVHRYAAGEVGITPHYDLKKYRVLIAALTVHGSAEFSLVEDPDPKRKLPSHKVVNARRAAPIIRSWETTPGDLMLMRAPGFAGMEDGRPLHQVSGGNAGGSRTALVFRMEAPA